MKTGFRIQYASMGLLLAAMAVAGHAQSPRPPETPSSSAPKTAHQAKRVKAEQKKLAWTDLSPAQQQALSPLAGEWDTLDATRKAKWVVIGNKFSTMKPEEQQRLQERMREWVKLSPEQRRIARESYARAKKLAPDQKSAQWEQYQQLPEEQKKKLAASAASKKRITTLPPPSQAKNKIVPPIKAAPKPLLERSVTPEVTNHLALQPIIPPSTDNK